MKRTAYIASALSGLEEGRERVEQLAEQLKPFGIVCLQTWSKGEDEDNWKTARRDLSEIEDADMVIVYTVGCEGLQNSGLHFEAGYALACEKNVILIGPKLNIFYKLPEFSKFADVTEFLETLKVVTHGATTV